MNSKSEKQVQENSERSIQQQNEGLMKIKQEEQKLQAQKQKGEIQKIDREGEWDLRLEAAKQQGQQSPVESTSPQSGGNPPSNQ